MSSFLKAEWRRLILLNYAVPPEFLRPHLAPGLTLDHWEGQTYVSLVAFEFLNTRVMGVKWPGFVNFPEINLRFYVRHGERRGVQFIKELVPSKWVAGIARALYNEPYQAYPMQVEVDRKGDQWTICHSVPDLLQLKAVASGTPHLETEDSKAHHFKEHSWGFGKSRSGKLLTYEVSHPHWKTWPKLEVDLEVDWERLYGAKWSFLGKKKPESTVLAEGSEISVSHKLNTNKLPALS